MPDLAALEVLVAVARRGSLSAAGRDVGMTQQAVSARVASVEAQTGVRLVTRSPSGSTLTPAGTVAVQWADRLLQLAQEVDAGLASLRESSRTRVRVSASLTIAEQLLPGWLVSLQGSALRRGATPVDVVLTATNSDHVIEQVKAGDADLGFVEGPRAPRGLRSRVIAHDELVLVVLPNHPWARRPVPVAVDEIARTPMVTREAGSGTRDFFESALESALAAADSALTAELGLNHTLARPALEMSTTASVRAAVLAGAGPAALSRLAVSDDIAAGRLRAIGIAGVDLRRDLRAIWLGGRTPPAGGIRDLLSHIGSITQA